MVGEVSYWSALFITAKSLSLDGKVTCVVNVVIEVYRKWTGYVLNTIAGCSMCRIDDLDEEFSRDSSQIKLSVRLRSTLYAWCCLISSITHMTKDTLKCILEIMSQSRDLRFPSSTVGSALQLLECGLQYAVEALGRMMTRVPM